MSLPSIVDDPQRARLRQILLERGLSENKIALRIGVPKTHLNPTLAARDTSFRAYRYRMRVERELGVFIWTAVEAAQEIAHIEKALCLDLTTAILPAIRRAAWKANVRPAALHQGVGRGYEVFRELIRHFFPNSKTLESAPYV